MAGGAGARWPGLLRPHALETTTVPDLWRRARRLDAGSPPWRRFRPLLGPTVDAVVRPNGDHGRTAAT